MSGRYSRSPTALTSALSALVRRDLLIMRRYPLNTAGAVLGLYALFLLVYVGGRSLVGPSFGETLGALIVGFFLFVMANASYQSLAGLFATEAKWGTLEQLYLSPIGFGPIAVLLSLSSLLVTFSVGFAMLALMLLTTGESISLDLLSIVPIVVLTLLSTIGLGLLFGGATVRYKNVSAVFGLVKFALVACIALGPASTEFVVLKLLPLTQGSYLLQRVMNEGVRLWELEPTELSVLAVVGITYFVLGYALFRYCTDRARAAGVMGHY
ncbi:ABC transporter [Natronococcus sp. A-GB1]|uniref:ABC transporter n=1 Tax=Natronococcus sp. A-GB1 TaxID=3037648 RepID=UPI00241E2191|nr:ABC transporter [Natronococcus sp. A-GB1]MDG5758560.1 ABC transporter [Natronococcus sp. A-GB1]